MQNEAVYFNLSLPRSTHLFGSQITETGSGKKRIASFAQLQLMYTFSEEI
jgi:hypothetical protein